MAETVFTWIILVSLGLALAGFIVFVFKQVSRPAHNLNLRPRGAYNFGGAWTDYRFDPDAQHPDIDDAPVRPRRTKRTRRARQKKRR